MCALLCFYDCVLIVCFLCFYDYVLIVVKDILFLYVLVLSYCVSLCCHIGIIINDDYCSL